jgi:hypothetical protein
MPNPGRGRNKTTFFSNAKQYPMGGFRLLWGIGFTAFRCIGFEPGKQTKNHYGYRYNDQERYNSMELTHSGFDLLPFRYKSSCRLKGCKAGNFFLYWMA